MAYKKYSLLFAVFLYLASGIVFAANIDGWYREGNYEPSTRIRVTLKNPLDIERKDCPVIIKHRDLPFTNFGPREIIVVDPSLPSRPEPTMEEKLKYGGHYPQGEENGAYIHYQLDDIDRDGIPDELFFLTDFKPYETKTIFLYIGYNNRGLYPHKTFAAIGDYARHPAPMWESEYLTWKLFFPTDIDIQAKRVPMLNGYYSLTMNMSGYHFDYDKGADIMTVSTTFGAGGICLFEHPADPDSISRPLFSPYRKTGPINDTRFVFDVVASGPLRSIVRAHTLNWRSGDGEYELEQYYTAWANKIYSTCTVQYLKFFPGSNTTAFGCGIRKIMMEDEYYQDGGIIISNSFDMPVIDPNPETIDRQRFTVDFAGIALVVKDKYQPEYQYVSAFQGNHTLRIPVTDDLTYEYLIAASWSENPVYNTPESFKTYILREALEYNNPIVVSDLKLEIKKERYKPVEYWGWDEVHKLR